MDQVYSHGMMVEGMKENTMMTKNKEKECSTGQMADATMVDG